MTHPMWVMLAIVGGWVACYMLFRVLLRRSVRWGIRGKPVVAGNQCKCGYDLAGLDIPRCPECGRAIGFDKTFEELGLSEAEIRQLAESKRKKDEASRVDE